MTQTLNLTDTQRNLLRQLRFREDGPGGEPCWIVGTAYGRYWLCVKTLMGTWARHSRVAAKTLRRLHSAGLIEHGTERRMPDWFKPDRLDDTVGATITLTAAGRRVLERTR